MQISFGMRATRIYRFAFAWGAVLTMVGCSSVSHHDSTSKTDSVVAPPEFAAACPIKQSAIDSLVVKTTGLAGVQSEIAALRTDMEASQDALRTDMEALRAELGKTKDALRTLAQLVAPILDKHN